MPCPTVFDAEDVHETKKLNEEQRKADSAFEVWQNMLGLGLGAHPALRGGRGTLQARKGGGVDGGHVGGGTCGDHGALALG